MTPLKGTQTKNDANARFTRKDANAEFQQFVALSKRLVNVPKKEIDEQREQDPRAKA